jgi:toxin ParE1/3/4
VTSKSSLRILKRSMAYRVKIVPRAQRDLLHLFERINARSSNAALIWYRGLKEAIRSLQDNPRRCPTTLESKALRHLLYGHKPYVYRVIYRVMETQKEVDILHIRHGAQQQFKTGDLK